VLVKLDELDPILGVQSTHYDRRGGYGADEKEPVARSRPPMATTHDMSSIVL